MARGLCYNEGKKGGISMTRVKILVALLAVPLLFSCGKSDADPMSLEKTAFRQTEEQTEAALGISFADFEKEEKDGAVTYLCQNFDGKLPVSGAQPDAISFTYTQVFQEEPLGLVQVALTFGDTKEQEKFEKTLGDTYGEPEERLWNNSDPDSAYDEWSAETEKERISIKRTAPGSFNATEKDGFQISYGWTDAYSAELLEQAGADTAGE